jgi:3'(2'), 5'-bisphosphate nucleotidase
LLLGASRDTPREHSGAQPARSFSLRVSQISAPAVGLGYHSDPIVMMSATSGRTPRDLKKGPETHMDTSLQLKSLLPEVVAIARRAGGRILEIYNSPSFDVEKKDDDSPLTAADLASHETIIEGLATLTPQIPVLSEESSTTDYAQRQNWQTLWIVDPLDGTKEVIKRNGEFTVNIALVHEHRPVLGVVHVPAMGVDYFGADGLGAFKVEGNESRTIQVSPRAANPARVVGSRSHRGPLLDGYLDKLGPHEIVAMGSSLKFCIVAEGGADVYPRLGPTSEWDTAAAQAVVEAAGGRVVDTTGNPLSYNARDELLNPHFLVFGDTQTDWLSYLSA